MKKRYVISVDLGGTNLKTAILDSKYKVIARKTIHTRGLGNPAQLIESIIYLTQYLVQRQGLNKTDIAGLGIGVPGPVDIKRGLVYFLPNIPGWKNIQLARILKQKLGLSIRIDNDANVFVLGEFHLGAAKGLKNVIGITLGTGVGGSLIFDGRLYRGNKFVAGEIGHIPIAIQGRRCNCGSRGCLESYVGNQRILTRARMVFKRPINLEELSSLARKGNPEAMRIWQTAGYLLGFALTGVVNVFNPDAIVIGGGIANAGSVLLNSIRNTIKQNAMPVQAKHVKVLKSKFGQDAGLIGAAILALGSVPQ